MSRRKSIVRCAPHVLLSLIFWAAIQCRTAAFPIIAEIDEEETMCFRYNVPHDDDAHMVFLALPEHAEDAVEDWYVTQLNEMTRKGGENFMKDMPETPEEVRKAIDGTVNQKSGLYLKLQKPRRPVLRHEMFRWYMPIIHKNLVQSSKRAGQGWDQPLGGYSICFENSAENEVKVLMDVVLVSDKGEDADLRKKKKKKLLSKEHLTPLEKNFQESITAAHQILNEMRYMEKREQRMKHTADSINARIRYFSYVSVGVLLGVTWMQVTYLRSYFKKKKLL